MLGVVVCDAPSPLRARLGERLASLAAVGWVGWVDCASQLAALPSAARAGLVLLRVDGSRQAAGELVRVVHRAAPQAQVLLLTMGSDPVAVTAGCRSGAVGYVARDASAAELAAVLALLPTNGEGGLTPREVQVLQWMSLGLSNARIARELFLSEETVKTHAAHVFRKLGVRERAHAVAVGLRRGLIE